MNSIRNKIQNALVGTVLIVGIFALIMVVINQLNVFQNQQIIQTMTMEYNIISMTDSLIRAYNNAGKNTGNKQFLDDYQSLRTRLIQNIELLKNRIISQESKMLLLGVEHTVNRVIQECDAGVNEMKANNFQYFSEHFAQAHKENEFVQSNTDILLQKELEYLSKTEEASKQIYIIGSITSGLIFLFIIVVMIIFAHGFSKQLITPIEQLTSSIKQVSTGNMDMTIDQNLIDQKDEVGILSKSFQMMVENIKSMIEKLNKSNTEMSLAKGALEKGNIELKKLNQFMVDREIKMIELKKKISELEKFSRKSEKI